MSTDVQKEWEKEREMVIDRGGHTNGDQETDKLIETERDTGDKHVSFLIYPFSSPNCHT